MIRLPIADDQALVRGALAVLPGLESDIEVVAQVGRGDEVVEAARASEATVALLDIEMPGIDGIAAASLLRTQIPGCRALIVTTFGRPGYLARAMHAGASGFVVKDTPAAELADAVRRVSAGLRVVDPVLAAESLAQGDLPLSERETDVLAAARAGGSIADIARMVHLSEGTVKYHLFSAIGRTGGRNRADAARVAVEPGVAVRIPRRAQRTRVLRDRYRCGRNHRSFVRHLPLPHETDRTCGPGRSLSITPSASITIKLCWTGRRFANMSLRHC